MSIWFRMRLVNVMEVERYEAPVLDFCHVLAYPSIPGIHAIIKESLVKIRFL